MSVKTVSSILNKQRDFFASGRSKEMAFRKKSLRDLKKAIQANEAALFKALELDLGKSAFEAYASEIGLVLHEISYHIRHMDAWNAVKRKASPISIFPSKSYVRQEPYGVCLIMAPWNYPFGLLMTPLIGAISAGNCVILKPANYSKNTSKIIEKIIKETFPEEYISVFWGGREVNTELLNETYDYVFFTGGPVLGKIVAEKAAQSFTPLTLELGGKSPCIVDEDANLKKAAKRIVWGKFLNLGQTCIAPDHLYVHTSIKEKFISYLIKEIKSQYGDDPSKSPDLGHLINSKAFDRIVGYVEEARIIYGGEYNKERLFLEPTLLDVSEEDSPVMKEEIFGPVLPVIKFNSIENLVAEQIKKDKPLAMYYFTSSKKKAEMVMNSVDSGGVCINDVLVQFVSSKIPFGGVGNSGMGAYHGKYSFNTFSRSRGMIRSGVFVDIPVKFAPYKNKLSLLKSIIK